MKLRITEFKNDHKLSKLRNLILFLLFFAGSFTQNANANHKELLETETKILNNGQTEVEVNLYNVRLNGQNTSEETNNQLISVTNYCNTDSEILAFNLTQNDSLSQVGCQNNDVLVICFKVNNFNSGSGTSDCNWLHGLVPDFGDCIAPVDPTFEGEPGVYVEEFTNVTGQGLWEWFPDGVVTYNDFPGGYLPPFTPVGAGWFYAYNLQGSSCNDPANPNCTFGDGGSCSDNNGFQWQVCFEAEVICLEPGETLCELSFRTFGDGETGSYYTPSECQFDDPWSLEFTSNCCDQPIIINEDFEFDVCSGDLFEVDITSDMDPITTYEWSVSPNSNGATAGSGSTISDVLTNYTNTPVVVYYYVTPTCAQGCVGITYTFAVTIFPEIIVEVFNNGPICEGQCIEVVAEVTGNNGYAGCVWNDGQADQQFIVVCPQSSTTYSVVITDLNGCTGEGSTVVEVMPELYLDLEANPGLEVCASEAAGGVSIDANIWGGSGYFDYQWSNGASGSSISVMESGTYSVTVFDVWYGCGPDVGSVNITIHDDPIGYIFGTPAACETEPLVCYDGQPAGGIWGGVADALGCIYPGSLGVGFHTLTYSYIDPNGCEGSDEFEVEILPAVTGNITQLADQVYCENTIDTYSIAQVPGATSYIWSVNGSGAITSGQGTTQITVDWTTVPGGTVCVTADNSCGSSPQSCFDVVVDPELDAPIISCFPSVNSIAFSWNAVAGATSYLVNGLEQSGTELSVNNLNPGDNVTIQVEAISPSACGGSIEQFTCTTLDCPIIDVAISGPEFACTEGTIEQLFATPAGGVFEGTCIIDPIQGIFNPVEAVPGWNDIVYSVLLGTCEYSSVYSIWVDAPMEAPQIICNSSVDAVSFSWTPVDGATGYLVNGTLQNATNFDATNLLPGEAVSITVEAIGTGTCGSTFAQSSCFAEDCELVFIQLEPVPVLCQDNAELLDLEVSIIGDNATGYWEGPGIIDPASGLFDSGDPALVSGANVVNFIYENGNCSQSESLSIEVYAPPIADAGESMVLTCAENEVLLICLGTGILSWTGPGIVSGADTDSPLVNAAGTYLLTVTDPISGCVATDQVAVTENTDTPEATVADPDSLTCTNQETTLNSFGSNSSNLLPSWEGPGITATNMNLSDPEVDAPGLYTLTILNTENGCLSNPATVEVLQSTAAPISEIIVYGALDCNNSGVIVAGAPQANVAYQWTTPGGAVITDASFEATEEGNYVLVVTNLSNGCTATESAQVESLVSVPLTFAGTDQEINCYNEVATLNGSASQTGPGIEYLWTGPAGGIISSADDMEISVNASGVYTLTVFDTNNGCSSTDEVYVTADVAAPTVDAGDTQEFGCNTSSLTLSGMTSSDATSYQWMNANQEVLSSNLLYEITDPGIYTLHAANANNGCSSMDNVMITEDSNLPTSINYEAIGASCAGDKDAYLEVQGVVGGTAPYQFALDGEEFTDWNSWSSIEAGVYDLVVLDASGCSHTETIAVPETQPIVIDLGGAMDVDLGESYTIELLTNLNSEAIETINWYPAELVSCLENPCLEVTFVPMFSVDVKVQVTDTTGCMMEGSVALRVDKNRAIFIPNAFSPNGDGSNDLFYPQGVDLSVVKIKRMAIFNRWGGAVFVQEDFPLNDPSTGWDGHFDGARLEPDVYVYMMEVEYVDGVVEQLAGDVLLMR